MPTAGSRLPDTPADSSGAIERMMTPELRTDTIFDIGMHIGQDTAFYLAKGFRVLAVDANPALVEAARRRFQGEIASGLLTILNVGIGQEEGTFPFYINAVHSEWSSFDREIGSRGGCRETIDVSLVRLEKVFHEHGVPYYLKIDIEGNDLAALRSLRSIAVRPLYVSIENGQPPILDLLTELGYERFKFINQAPIPSLKLPQPAREGRDVPDWRFEFGASGPFGEETPGNWETAAGIGVQISAYWNNPELDPNIHGWYDLHASRKP